MSHHMNASMAGLCAGAGCYAFYKKRSLPSLVASMALAAGYGVSTYLIQSNKNPQLGHDIASVTSGLLMATMGPRALKTRAAVPIVLSVAGTGTFGYNLKKSIDYREPAELDSDVETVKVAQ